MKSVWMLCCALLLAACGQEEVAKAETGQPAPPILALGPHDEVVSLPAQAERPLILNFWSATCGMCIKELREIQDFQAARPQAVDVLAVNIDGADGKTLQALATQRGLTLPLAADQMGATAERYRVNGTPTNYLIGRDGQILEHKAGMLDTADLQRWFSAR